MISILCPSRGRSDKVRKMAESALTLADGVVEVLFFIDLWEEEGKRPNKGYTNNQRELGVKFYDKGSSLITTGGPDQPTNLSWNQLAQQAKGEILIVCGDDVEFKTQGWDTKLKEAAAKFPDGYCILSCNDGRGGSTSHPHPIYTRKMYEALGYVMHPSFLHWGPDDFAAKLGHRLGRHIWLEDVLLEHQKPSDTGLGDETHNRIRKGWMHGRDMFVKEHPATRRALEAEVAHIQQLIVEAHR